MPLVGRKKDVWIAVIPLGSPADAWKHIHEGALQGGRDFGIRVVWCEPTPNLTQPQIIADCIAHHASGIVLAPVTDAALEGPVRKAQSDGIPVVIIDSPLRSGASVSVVKPDNYRAGGLAAQRAIEILGGKGSVVLMRCWKDSEAPSEREQGFLETLKGSGVNLISDSYYGGNDLPTSLKTAKRLIEDLDLAHRTHVAVVTVTENNTVGMLTELEATKVAGKVKFIGFDACNKLIEGLRDGEIDALLVPDFNEIGYLGVKALSAKISGKFFDSKTLTDVIVVDRDNMAGPEMKALLAPPAAY